VTGLAFVLDQQGHPYSPSLDRKHEDFGYTPENTQAVVNAYNCAKGSWGDGPVELMAYELCKRRGFL
jgi:hypothetical protein